MKYLLRIYKLLISPLLGTNCRFMPTCSEYAAEACQKHGYVKGGWLSFKRVCKCNPFGPSGIDNVPD